MPESMSIERRKMLLLLGAKLELTAGRARHERRHRPGPGDRSRRRPARSCPSSSTTPPTPQIHRDTTAEEIWNDTDGAVDVVVSGVGTGGTITGVGQVLKARKPVGADDRRRARRPRRCCPAAQPGPHKIQGIGAGFVPAILDRGVIDEVIQVSNDDAFAMARSVRARSRASRSASPPARRCGRLRRRRARRHGRAS